MAKKVTIELTETQAKVMLLAIEGWFRLRMGQHYQTADDLAFLGYTHDPEKPGAFDERINRRNAIKEVLGAVMRIAFPVYGTPTEIDSDTHIVSDIWSQLRWELSTKDEWMSTPFQLGPEPMPKITVEDDMGDKKR